MYVSMIHMKKLVSGSALAILLISPLTLSAESITPLSGPTTILPTGQTNSGKPLMGSGTRTANHPMMVGTTTGGIPESGPHGGRMMASDTRPLPPALDGKIMNREMGSTTGKGGDGMMRGEMKGSSTENGAMMRERTGGHRGDIFHQAGSVMLKRMQAALDRFTKLADRIDSRIVKMKASGTDTKGAEAGMIIVRSKLLDADKAISDVNTKIADVANAINDATTTSPSVDEKKPAKDAMERAKQSLVAVQKALEDVVSLILGEKGMSTREHASSTVASATPKLPGMMRTQERPMPTTTNEHPDGTL